MKIKFMQFTMAIILLLNIGNVKAEIGNANLTQSEVLSTEYIIKYDIDDVIVNSNLSMEQIQKYVNLEKNVGDIGAAVNNISALNENFQNNKEISTDSALEANGIEKSKIEIDKILKNANSEEKKKLAKVVLENSLTKSAKITVLDEIDKESSMIQLVSILSNDVTQAVEELNNINGVLYAEPNYRIKATDSTGDDISKWGMTSITGIHAEEAWQLTDDTQKVMVAVIDTGVYIDHRNLTGHIAVNRKEKYSMSLDNDANGYCGDKYGWDFTTYKNSNNTDNGDNSVYDDPIKDSHGTHVAGIIAAGASADGWRGVSGNAEILPVKILDGEEGTIFNAVKGIEYAEMRGAKIANCSWGTYTYSQFLHDAIKKSNMLFVCAAGNESKNVTEEPFYPASYELDNVISVGASNLQGNISDFSNYGNSVDIAAPGEEIYSTYPENKYEYLNGTSMAAPFVSGAAATLLGMESELSAVEVKERILNTASSVESFEGKIDACRMLNLENLVKTAIKPTEFSDAFSNFESVVAENSVYIIGGYNGMQYLNNIRKFNPTLGIWQDVSIMPEARADCIAVCYNKKIYIIGGNNGNVLDRVDIYDIENNNWSIGTEMPTATYGAAYAVLGNMLYIFGGIENSGNVNTVYTYDMESDVWTEKSNLPQNISYAYAVNAENEIYLFGGNNGNTCLSDIYKYDVKNDVFKRITSMAEAKNDFSAAYFNGKIYIFGGNKHCKETVGNNDSGNLSNKIEVYDIKKETCMDVDTLDEPMSSFEAINYFDSIYILGGYTGVYKNSATRYYGINFPKNISVKTFGSNVTVSFEKVPEATDYNIELNGVIYRSYNQTSYTIDSDETKEEKIRVCSVINGKNSLWSEYIYHYHNSTMEDAFNVVNVNGREIAGNLYRTGQTKWYKFENDKCGELTVTLKNIPEGCNYLLQLCNLGGDIIATGKANGATSTIEKFVVNRYNYYIRITSLYGGSNEQSYRLQVQFKETTDTAIPGKIRSAFLRPSSLGNAGFDSDIRDISEETDIPPLYDENTLFSHEKMSVSSGKEQEISTTAEEANAEESIVAENITLTGEVREEKTTTGTMPSQGSTVIGNITAPLKNLYYDNRAKLAIEVIPECADDIMRIAWYDTNASGENFCWHWVERNNRKIYYIDTVVSMAKSNILCGYKIYYDKKSPESNGNYTLHTYVIVDKRTKEDYGNEKGTNDMPTLAEAIDIKNNQSTSETGFIDHRYDRDFYYFTASSSEKVTVWLESPEGKKYSAIVYDNDGTKNETKSSDVFTSYYHSDGTLYTTMTGKTSSSRKYCIMVSSDDETYSPTETYTLHICKYELSKLGNLEVNDTFEEADALSDEFCSSYVGNSYKTAMPIKFCLDSRFDCDMYAVELAQGDKLSINMRMENAYDDLTDKYRIEVYSNVRRVSDTSTKYTSMSFDNPDSSNNKYSTIIAEQSGRYYVAVRSLNSSYNYTHYGYLTITKTSASGLDEHEALGYGCSNDFARTTLFVRNSIEVGMTAPQFELSTPINANFDNELDTDWYAVVNTESVSKTAIIHVNGTEAVKNAMGIIVLDASFTLLSSGVSGKTYTFEPNAKYYIATYVKENNYSYIIGNTSYTISIELDDLRNELVFKPLDWGTFIYDNDPELLINDDLADYNLGDRFLMSADNLSGVIDFQSSHSIMPYILNEGAIKVDMLMYNPTEQPVTVVAERIGYQAPYENSLGATTIDWTTTNWACLQAWADFLHFNIDEKMLIGDLKMNYKDYNFKDVTKNLPNGGVYEIQPGEAVWLLGETAELRLTASKWSPFNFLARFNIPKGKVNIGFAAFRERGNVYSPKNAKLIYDIETQRSYPSGYICSHECDCLCTCECGEVYERNCVCPKNENDKCQCRDNSCVHICVKEHDLDGKPKGIANSVAEVQAETQWEILDEYSYFKPTLYNYANEDGYTLGGTADDYWITHFNPNVDPWGFNNGVENDILPLKFYDEEHSLIPWIFDTRHTKPSLGNGKIAGAVPVGGAMPLGNYGVVERYIINIKNTTDVTKTVSYNMKTVSHAIVMYGTSGDGWNVRIKTGELSKSGEFFDDFQRRINKEIFSIEVLPKEQKTLTFEVILPNADGGGLKHQLYAH